MKAAFAAQKDAAEKKEKEEVNHTDEHGHEETH